MIQVVAPASLNPKGTAQLTSISSATSLSNIPVGAKFAYLQAETENVRFTDDGTDPSSSNGCLLIAGAQPLPYVGDVQNLKFIEATSGAILNVMYYTYTGQ